MGFVTSRAMGKARPRLALTNQANLAATPLDKFIDDFAQSSSHKR
jgi:hypothetical protein